MNDTHINMYMSYKALYSLCTLVTKLFLLTLYKPLLFLDQIGFRTDNFGSDRIRNRQFRIGSDSEHTISDQIGFGTDNLGSDRIGFGSKKLGSDRISKKADSRIVNVQSDPMHTSTR